MCMVLCESVEGPAVARVYGRERFGLEKKAGMLHQAEGHAGAVAGGWRGRRLGRM